VGLVLTVVFLFLGGDEPMKNKLRIIVAALALLGLVSGSAAYADGFAPGEGLYVGAFAGGAMGIVKPKVVTQGALAAPNCGNLSLGELNVAGATSYCSSNAGGTFEATDGGLGLAGIEGGGMLGYGFKMGDGYIGLEGEMAAGDVEFKLTSAAPVTLMGGGAITATTIQTVEAKKEWTGGMFGRIGYYVNKDTLLTFKGGVLVSKFDVKTTGSTDYSETFYGGGPSFGGAIESRLAAVDPNLSIRIGAVYTDFLTASVFRLGELQNTNDENIKGHDSEVTGSALSARVGLQYSFFDVNSLF